MHAATVKCKAFVARYGNYNY